MTALAKRKTGLHFKTRLYFETSSRVRGKRLVIHGTPWVCTVWRKGTRTRYEVPWHAIFRLAVKAQMDSKKRRADRPSLIRRR
ncbi:MAG TPA: hypothetical protein VGR84_19110 [Candidatus Acidoferrales bacterium]|nr:hypothetical protein [Candidatus Acidoferrales bacterium]